MNKAIFLDRDGVINEDKEYVGKIEDFNFLSGIFGALRKFQSLGYKLFIITNQSGIGRGYYSKEDFLKLNNYMLNTFSTKGINISKVYHCPHKPEDDCSCRKPKPGMLEQAIREFNIDVSQSWAIGDKLADIESGERVGCKTLLIDSRYVKDYSGFKLKNLKEASGFILKNTNL